MTVDKAIKNLKAGRKDCGMMDVPMKEYTSTIDLAIEALKRIREQCRFGLLGKWAALKGETEK